MIPPRRLGTAGSLLVLLLTASQLPAGASVERAPAAAPAAGGGTLSISVPASANLGTASTAAGSVGAALGQVTVTQSSSVGLLPGWTTTVSTTAFTTTAGAMSRSIPAVQVSYLGGGFTSTGVALGNCVTSSVAQTLVAPRTAYACGSAATIGTSVVKWNPTVTVTFPTSPLAGTYQATITHSVS